MLMDMGLIAAVTAARENGMNADLEFLWYPVWVIAIKDWMFPNSNTATVACNVAPQYVLSHMYRTEGCTKLKRQWVIPDFAQILQQVHTFSNGTRKLGRQKVILMVENKPTRPRKSFLLSPNPFVDAEDQITKQAVFAFMADSSLHVIGVILAFGARWKYVEFYRPSGTELEAWMAVGDGTYGQEKPKLAVAVPRVLRRLSCFRDDSFELLDHMGLSAQAFEIIAQRVKNRESKMWNL
jgi:hypothetical protein